jgi:hypothetical protein
VSSDSADIPTTQEDARGVVVRIASDDTFKQEHPLIGSVLTEDDLRSIVDLAWHYQFLEDRLPFKKAMREMEQYVAAKARNSEESQ